MSNLFHFLTDLAVNPQKQVAFATDPEALIEMAGLSEADKAVLKSRDRHKIDMAFTNVHPLLSRTCIDPGPDPWPDPDPLPEEDSSEED